MKTSTILTLLIAILIGFGYGVLTVKYEIFPYRQLVILMRTVGIAPSVGDYYHNRVSFFEQHTQSNYDALFIGDSHIDAAEWHDLFPSQRIANHGISGDKTSGVLNRLDGIDKSVAPKVFILIGANDFQAGIGIEEVFANYEKIVTTLSQRGLTVYIQSTIMAGQKGANINPKIAALNTQLQQLSTQMDSVQFIDLNQQLAPNSFLEPKYTRDGIHLNGAGYQVWQEILEAYLQ